MFEPSFRQALQRLAGSAKPRTGFIGFCVTISSSPVEILENAQQKRLCPASAAPGKLLRRFSQGPAEPFHLGRDGGQPIRPPAPV